MCQHVLLIRYKIVQHSHNLLNPGNKLLYQAYILVKPGNRLL